jgi:hypothetical protein
MRAFCFDLCALLCDGVDGGESAGFGRLRRHGFVGVGRERLIRGCAGAEAESDQRARIGCELGLPAMVGLVLLHGGFGFGIPFAAWRAIQIVGLDECGLDLGGALGRDAALSEGVTKAMTDTPDRAAFMAAFVGFRGDRKGRARNERQGQNQGRAS